MEDRLMLSSMHILSLKQGKLYGDRIPIEALQHGFKLPQHFVVLFLLIGMWRERTKKGPAEAGPEVAEPQRAASVA
jgi:hypothetical protein